MKNTVDDSSVFEFGDQDYGSAVGWQPWGPTEAEKEQAGSPEMLYARPVSEWLAGAMETPPSPELFGPFWLMDELVILFAPTGVGKSALAVQLAECLARGVPMPPFEQSKHLRPQRILYLDFELDSTQFAMRYAGLTDDGAGYELPYDFSPNFIRAEMSWDGRIIDGYEGFSDMFFQSISDKIDELETTVLIVDNITFLDRTSTTNVNTALSIMRALSAIKRQKLVSILVLAHAAKRIERRPLTHADMQGSINLANFADSIFAMGTSCVKRELRYLKQIKSRSGRIEHHADNVAVYTLEKFDAAARAGLVQNTSRPVINNMLGMKFEYLGPEFDHLEPIFVPKRTGNKDAGRRKSKIETVRKMAAEGKSRREIGMRLGLSRATVYRLSKC